MTRHKTTQDDIMRLESCLCDLQKVATMWPECDNVAMPGVRRPAALENSLVHGKCKLKLLMAERPALAQLRK